MGPAPTHPPIGLHLARVAREVRRAFDDALAEAGGSLPVWLVLLNLTLHPGASQRELADAVGVREATLTHHLNAMEEGGLLTRRRDPANRRVHVVEATEAGRALFLRLREAATGFDARLRRDLPEPEVRRLRRLLDRVARNVEAGDVPPWPRLAGRDPAGRDPAGRDPAGRDPAGRDPAGHSPAGQPDRRAARQRRAPDPG